MLSSIHESLIAMKSLSFSTQRRTEFWYKKAKKRYTTSSTVTKKSITTLITRNAASELTSPMIMISCKRMPTCIVAVMPELWGLGKSDNGWITAECFWICCKHLSSLVVRQKNAFASRSVCHIYGYTSSYNDGSQWFLFH